MSTEPKGFNWSAIKYGTSVALVVAGLIWSYADKDTRIVALETSVRKNEEDIKSCRADIRATDNYLRDVAHKLDLFMCSQDQKFCGTGASR